MGQRTRWHNDQPYWPVRGRQVLSFWIARDSASRWSVTSSPRVAR